MTWLSGLLGSFGGIGGALINQYYNNKQVDKANQNSQLLADKEYERQKEFAQHGLKWSVDQAKELGINPLVVAGGASASYSPSSQVFSGGGTDFSGPLSNMGQSIGRALSAVMSPEERAKKELLDTLSLEHAKLRNDYMQAQIDSIRSTLSTNSNSPSLPTPSGITDSLPAVGPVTTFDFDHDSRSYNSDTIAPFRFVYDKDGKSHRVFTKDFNDSIDSDYYSQFKFAFKQGAYDFSRLLDALDNRIKIKIPRLYQLLHMFDSRSYK